MKIEIDTQRLKEERELLAAIPGARDLVTGWCREHGLEVRQDAVGNTFARWAGSQPELPAVAVGAIRFLQAFCDLHNAGYRPRRPVELILFASAGPASFGVGCLGSRLLSGSMPAWKAARLSGTDGKTFDEWRAEAGCEGPLESVALAPGHYAAFVDLRIEHGGDLKKAGMPLGIVTGFAPSAGLRVTVEGGGGQDALCAAAEIEQEVTKISMGKCAVDCVASSVASRFRLDIEVANADQAKRDQMISQIATVCRDTAQRRRLSVKAEVLHMDAATECGAAVVDALTHAAQAHSLSYGRMVSPGADDAQFLSRIAPAAMLLVPDAGGIASGTLVLADALAELAG
jgi:N-carbamoyl-L-amino-acid hydrolase